MTRPNVLGRRAGRRTLVLSAVAFAALSAILPGTSGAANAVPGGSGTDTSLVPTDSKVTLNGRGRFSGLKVAVNQTRNLANQAISVTWTGGTPTTIRGGGPGIFGEHFLQMFQCWGDDDGTNAENPGPPPEQCQQGATNGQFGGSATGQLFQGNATTRVVSQRADPTFNQSLGTLDEFGQVSLPFRAVDGTVVPQWRDTKFNPELGGGDYWLNPYFNIITTNEIVGARTAPDGSGADVFEATTGLESTGLGCGQKVQKLADGSTKVPRCWLVVVPRGAAEDENNGAAFSPLAGVSTSPLAPVSWKNRIAFSLEYNPLDSSCPLSAEQRRIIGSELLSAAVSSWQPALCATPGLSPYAYGALSDGRARQQLLSGTPGAPGMAVVSRPIDPALVDGRNAVVYAPLTLSGTVIGFNIERKTQSFFPPGSEPTPEVLAAEDKLAGVRVAELNLTPRLVAKLLTQSYRSQVEIAGSKPPYPWSAMNPLHLNRDPDFLRFNPEFELLTIENKNMGGLVLAGPASDAALQVWEWVFSDPEARAWLAGAADEFGMKVNPIYSTAASVNPQGTSFGDPLPDTYPKSDAHCFQGPEQGPLKVTPPPLCGLDWSPYTQTLRDAARATRVASDGAKTDVNPSPSAPDQVYKRDPPQALGQRGILSITDSASAAQYGVQTARLSRAGDNASGREFIAPNPAGLLAGGRALTAKSVPKFLEPSPTTTPAGAYPLTALTYAAVAPLSLDATARKEYAAFVEYAAGKGQVRGYEYGLLPPGYEPLPEELRVEARKAATTIRDLKTVDDAGAPASTEGSPGSAASGDPASSGAESADGEPGRAGSPELPTSASPSPTGPASKGPAAKTRVEKVLASVATPLYDLAATRYALPVLIVVALLSALGVLEITKRRPRRSARSGRPMVPALTDPEK